VSVYVSTSALRGASSLWELLDELAAAGLTHVELGAAHGVHDGQDLDERLAACGLRLLVHNYFPPPREEIVLNLASADGGVRERSFALVRRAVALCARVGAPFYSVHAGFVRDPVGFDGTTFVFPGEEPQAAERAEAARRFGESLALAVQAAAADGVDVIVENHVFTAPVRGFLLFETADELGAAVDDAGAGVLLDTGHLSVSAATIGLDPEAFLAQLGSRVRAFHLHDNDGTRDAHLPVAPGGWVEAALRDPSFARAERVVEARFESVDGLRAHAEWLRSLA
jgi:sugar phosphate isomerase/epimerase